MKNLIALAIIMLSSSAFGGITVVDNGPSTKEVDSKISLVQALDSSGNRINLGSTTISGSVAVTGTFWQATQPVSGTVAATQSGTWTVQPGNTANTTAWKVDGSAVTQPVSAASLPLPSGAATAAKQDTVISSLATIASNTGEGANSFVNITSATTTVVKSGAGTLHTVVINTRGTVSTATIYDNTAGSGTKIATIDTTLSTTSFTYDASFSTGLTVVTVGAADITITYR